MLGLSATVVDAFIGGKEGADLFLIERPGLGFDAVTYAGAFNSSLDQAGVLQLFEVLGYGWLSEPQDFDQVTVDASVGLDQVLDDGNPRRMGQGLHYGGEFVLLICEYLGFGQTHAIIVSLQYYD